MHLTYSVIYKAKSPNYPSITPPPYPFFSWFNACRCKAENDRFIEKPFGDGGPIR